MPSIEKMAKELIDFILKSKPNIDSLNNKKIYLATKYNLKKIPLNSEIYKYCDLENKKELQKYLTIKDSRSLSGVNVVAVMCRPGVCPHGKCIFCPGGLDMNVPQSYTGSEPASMRAIANNYDSYLQVKNRISQLENVGHDVSKIELIIMGGTFNNEPLDYQEFFVKRIYDALSNKEHKSLKAAKKSVETCNYRPVGLTIETRPDMCSKEEIKNLLNLGATRIELGVQTLSNKIYNKVNRGHTIKDVKLSTQLLKDSGLKVLYHIMPGLYSDSKKDIKMFSKLFKKNYFKPDMLKIYPLLIMPNTKLFNLWKENKYKVYNDDDFFNFLKGFYPLIPYWNRVMRIQRDIPITKISDGPKKTNMREEIFNYCIKNKINIKEIRFRQLGFKESKCENYKIFVEKYFASKGKEFFISYETENRDQILGFIRLRFPHKPFIGEIKNSALVRELHVYGKIVKVNDISNQIGQHQGIGKLLLQKAEEIALKNKYKKISVISGLGVREYYYKQGYFEDGFYVSKYLK